MRKNIERLANELIHLSVEPDGTMTRLLVLPLAVLFIFGALRLLPTDVTADALKSKETQPSLARMNERVSVRAAGRGNPWISLSDGHDLLTAYTGQQETIDTLERNQAQPLSLTSADYDEDGVPDLICGNGSRGAGVVTLHRGNVDSIYPNTLEAAQRKAEGAFTDAPFVSPAGVFSVSDAADFICAGDFDGDSHWDVVTAARGSTDLFLLSGDGRGGLGEPKAISLPGRVTAMIAGEINRRDGLDDLIVAVATPAGAKALVFEGPEGALRSNPEAFPMPAEVASLALGQLDDSFEIDLALAPGHDLVIVHGRDRKLSLDDIRQREVPQARVSVRSFPFEIRSIATGDFTGNHSTEIALLSDQGSISLLTRSASGNQKASKSINEWKSKPLTEGRWSQFSQLVCARVSSVPIDNLVVVDSQSRSLTIVADEAEDWRGREVGTFAGAAYRGVLAQLDTDAPVAALPMRLNGDALSDLVVLSARQDAPMVVLSRAQSAFTVNTTADSGPGSLRQAILDANSNPGFDLISFDANLLSGSGEIFPSTPLPTIIEAVVISGPTPSFGRMLTLDGRNFPQQPVTGVDGLRITGGNSLVSNLSILRFGDDGIEIANNGGNTIIGNLIGTDISGSVGSGNRGDGVFINGSPRNTIGGTITAARNVISGNGSAGVGVFDTGATGNLVQGNFIGVDNSGSRQLRNFGGGIAITDAPSNAIGGTTAAARNLISGNSSGVAISRSNAIQNLVQGNFIGTNAAGNARLEDPFSQQRPGVSCSSPSNTIGGTTAAARNVISANSAGVIASGDQTLVQGNFIGTDAAGGASLGNASCGVSIFSNNSTIGGASVAARNVISGNASGVSIGFSGSSQVQNNFIGTNTAGNAPIGNATSGVIVGSSNNLIGGSAATGNTIAFNGGSGVLVESGIGTSILGNSILSNGELGIKTAAGANNDNSAPVLLSVSRSGGAATVRALLNSTPNKTFRVEFFSNTSCDPSGYGEGEGFLGFASVTTDPKGNVTFAAPIQLAQGQRISATATDPRGNTSEFSNCIEGNALGADPYIRMTTPGVSGAQTASLVTYAISVRNGGSETATGVTVNDVVPPGAVFIFVETEQGSSSSPMFLAGGTASVFIGSINPGGSAKIRLTLKVTASPPQDMPIQLRNTATVTSTSLDSNQSNNSASVSTEVISGFGAADLSATSSTQENSVAAGTRQSFTVTVRNAGPHIAKQFAVVDVIPAGTTFASIAGGFEGCKTPPVGREGLIVCGLGDFSPGFSATFTFVVNVLQSPGSNVTNNVTTFSSYFYPDFDQTCIGNPLQVPNGSADPNGSNNTGVSNTPVRGGRLVLLSWEQPSLNPGSTAAARNAAPANLQVRPNSAVGTDQSLRRIVLPEEGGSCFLTRVNIYKSDLPKVQPISNNLWKSVPPDQVQSTMAAAPAGSFYLLTNVWKCDDMEVESGGSNECSSAGTCAGGTNPTITGACRGEGKLLIVNGSGFVEGAKVFLNGEQEKTSFVSSTQVIAKKAGKRAATGDTLMVRNPDGTETAQVSYTKTNCSP